MIAKIERVAAHNNGAKAAPYVSVFFIDDEGRRMHAVVFPAPGQLAVVSIDDPTERHRGDGYEADLRAAIGEVALDAEWKWPARLRCLVANVAALLDVVRRERDSAPAGFMRAQLRHLSRSVEDVQRGLERVDGQ